MPYTDTVIIGAGHAGLAMRRCGTERDVRHVFPDRGCVGERCCTARWNSVRQLTPNWLSRLPGWRYTGPEPDGFMSADEFVGYLCDLHAIGQRFQHWRNSTFVDGARHDAEYLTDEITANRAVRVGVCGGLL